MSTSIDNVSVMVSISAVSAVQDTVDQDTVDQDTIQNDTFFASTLTITSAQDTANSISATTSDSHQASTPEEPKNDIAAHLSKLPILLPPVEIESRTANDDDDDSGVFESTDPLPSSRDSAQLSKQGAAKVKTVGAASTVPKVASKPATTGAKKPLSASTGRATGATKSTTSSLTKTAPSSTTLKQRPPIPDSLKRSVSSSVATAPSATSSSTASRSSTSTISVTSSTTSQLRRFPSTPSLSSSIDTDTGTGLTRNSTGTGRRVASNSGADIGSSPRSSPSGTPGQSRPPSQASIKRPLATSSTAPNTSTATTSRHSHSGSSTCRKAQSSLAPNPIVRQTANTSSFSKPVPRPTLVPTITPTPVRKTPAASTPASTTRSVPATSTPASTTRSVPATSTSASTTRSVPATTTRPVTDAVKVKMLSTQLNGLQEKHEQTLKLLQDQEERMKRELEELSVVPEPQRKPISSDVQEVLKEMEDLRKQFNDAKAQHEKALEDLAAERTLEVSQLREAHEALLSALTAEKDTVAESLKASQETGEQSTQENDVKVKELEEQIESSFQSHADAVSKHGEALESLRIEIESTWAKKHEAIIMDLIKSHEERIKAMEDTAVTSGSVKDTELQKFKDAMDQQIKELEDEQENRILELIAMQGLEIQDWKDNMRNQADAHHELMEQMKQEHAEEIEKLRLEVQTARSSKAETESDLDRVNSETRGELEEVHKLLALKEAKVAELTKRIQELTSDLENASMSTLLKNTNKYQIKDVQLYGSSVSGNLKIKRAQQSISDSLEHFEILCEFVDISVSEEAKKYMRRKNGGELQLPQIFSGGEYRGLFEDFEYAIETHQLPQFLGFDRVKAFVPRHKVQYNPSRAHFAQDGEDAEQGAGLPAAVVNGKNDRSATTLGPRVPLQRPRSKTDIGTSMFLLPPGSRHFQAHSSLSSNGSSRGSWKPGFVQAASQVWDGALREDITQAKHDLGINKDVIQEDDDELEELYERGDVSAADLEALMESFEKEERPVRG